MYKLNVRNNTNDNEVTMYTLYLEDSYDDILYARCNKECNLLSYLWVEKEYSVNKELIESCLKILKELGVKNLESLYN